jgi:hypothetical protein
MKRTSTLTSVVAMAILMAPAPSVRSEDWGTPLWAKNATYLWSDGPLRCVKITSPDSRKTVYVGPTHLDVRIDDRWAPFPAERWEVETLAELLWAPDSSAFVVTQSDGGDVGTWLVAVYVLEGNGVARFDVARTVRESFQKRHPCDEPEDANVGAIAWLGGSKKLLLAAEVPPHSNCREMGKLGGFVVEVPSGRIIQELSDADLRAKWGSSLGERLRASSR